MIATVFDTETTGLIINPARKLDAQPEIISIAIQSVNLMTEELFDDYYKVFRPIKSISQEITRITGFTDNSVKDAPRIIIHLDDILARLSGAQLLIGQNITFDMGMINSECQRYNRVIKWPKCLDLVENSIFIKGYRLSLTNLHKELFGTDFVGAHDATVDVRITVKCAIDMFKRGWL
jgi:DNA polymerase III epsilon subunit-like protein